MSNFEGLSSIEIFGLIDDLVKQGKIKETCNAYDRMIELQPDGETYYLYAFQLMKFKLYTKAIEKFNFAIENGYNKSYPVFLNLSLCYMENGEYELALEVVEKGFKCEEGEEDIDEQLYFSRGKCLFRLGKIIESISDLEKASNGGLSMASYMLGQAYRDQKRYTEALDIFIPMTKSNGYHKEKAAMNAAEIYFEIGEYEQCIRMSELLDHYLPVVDDAIAELEKLKKKNRRCHVM